MINNPDIQVAGYTLDLAAKQDEGGMFAWAVDLAKDPDGAVTAIAVDGAMSLFNLGALILPGVDEITTKSALESIANLGYNDPLEYYTQHPQATQMMGLLAGGWKISTLGGTHLMNMLRKGSAKIGDDGVAISKIMRLEQEANVLKETVHHGSAAYAQALKRVRVAKGLDMAGELAAQSIVFDLAMSQHALMEDTTIGDYVLMAGLLGAGGYALKSLPMMLKDTKLATEHLNRVETKAVLDQVSEIPHEFRGTSMEPIMLQAKVSTVDRAIADGMDLPAPTITTIKKSRNRLAVKVKEGILKLVDEPLRLDATAEEAVQGGVKIGIYKALARLVEHEPLAVAGITKVKAFNENLIPAFEGGSIWDDLAVKAGGKFNEAQLRNIQVVTRQGIMEGKKLDEIIADLGLKSTMANKSMVNSAMDFHNTTVLDLRTGKIVDIDTANRLITSADISGLKYSAGLSYNKSTAAQLHFNYRTAAEGAGKFTNMNLARTFHVGGKQGDVRRALNTMTTEERITVQEYLASKKKLIGTEITEQLFWDMHYAKTLDEVKALVMEGMPIEEIALRTNTKIDRVGAAIAKNFDGVTGEELIQAVGKEAWKLEGEAKLFIVKGDIGTAVSNVNKAVALDQEAIHALNNEHIARSVTETGSQLLNNLYDIQTSGLGSLMREGLEQINPALFKGRTAVSADMALRHQDKIAEIVLRLGGAIKDTVRKYMGEATKGMSLELRAFSTDPVMRTQFGQTLNALRTAAPAEGEIITVLNGKLGIAAREEIEATFKVLTDIAGNPLNKVDPQIVAFWARYEQTLGKEIFQLQNFNRSMQGLSKLTSKGIKVPPINMSNEFIAYIPGAGEGGRTLLLHSPTQAGLDTLVASNASKYPKHEIITRGSDAKAFNILEGHAELEAMGLADFAKGKTSTSYDTTSAGIEQIEGFQRGVSEMYRKLANRSMRSMNTESVDFLRTMHDVAGVQGKESVWQSIEKTAFGESELHLNETFAQVNEGFTRLVSKALGFLDEATGQIRLGKGNANTVRQVTEAMEGLKAKGFTEKELPWQSINEGVAQTEVYKNAPQYADDAIATLNFTTATLALRFMELAHPLVTALSIPITTMPEIIAAMRNGGHSKFSSMKLMQEGTHRAFSKAFESDMARWDRLGITNIQVSEMTEKVRDMVVKPSLIQKLDDNKFFKILTKPSDLAEGMARRVAASTASVIFERLHGKGTYRSAAGDAFIDLFTKRAMGNYNTTQRPVMFQGTLGSAIGLFQTYTWTMGQNIYRYLEAGQPGIVASLMGVQAGIFGLRSLPGYDGLNQYIGAHYGNPDHQDITTTIYEAFSDSQTTALDGTIFKDAETVLYGLPATLFNTALYTRGVLNPRSPITLDYTQGSIQGAIPALAPVVSAIKTMGEISDRIRNDLGIYESTVAAVQLQQLSRPISRLADFMAGRSIEKSGAVVDPNVPSPLDVLMGEAAMDLAMFARVSGARPLKEQLLRDTGYQNSFYNKANSWNRRETIKAVRGLIQNGQFEGDAAASTYHRYVDAGGSNQGWNSLVNEGYLNSKTGKVLDDSRLTSVQQILPE